MKHLGYGNKPYFVYKRADLERVHFHVVSTRINCDTGKKSQTVTKKKRHSASIHAFVVIDTI
jgi:hypothetical protein